MVPPFRFQPRRVRQNIGDAIDTAGFAVDWDDTQKGLRKRRFAVVDTLAEIVVAIALIEMPGGCHVDSFGSAFGNQIDWDLQVRCETHCQLLNNVSLQKFVATWFGSQIDLRSRLSIVIKLANRISAVCTSTPL